MPATATDLHVYDTTLRDGAQQEGLNLSVADKLVIARQIDELGVGFIEGGWPGANPKDTEFFARAHSELTLRNATLTAFGATRRADGTAADDPLVRALVDSQAPVVTLVAKSHVRHVEHALRTTLAENLAMIRDTVSFLRGEGRRVFLDAEHFFDGYAADRAYALECVRTAAEAGAEVIALCDTNGGMLPAQVADVVRDVIDASAARVGIHCHNDTGCAVANSLAAVAAGATHVQGTVNGYGERTGNANILTVIGNLQIKQGLELVAPERLREATRIAHAISEVTNVPPYSRQPYVGASAFTHKAGIHAKAILNNPSTYEILDPADFGLTRYIHVAHRLTGWNAIKERAEQLQLALSDDAVKMVTAQIKAMADQKRLTLDDVDYLLRAYHSAVVDAEAIAAMESLELVAAD